MLVWQQTSVTIQEIHTAPTLWIKALMRTSKDKLLTAVATSLTKGGIGTVLAVGTEWWF